MKGVFRAHGNCFACLDIKDEVEEAWREVALRVHASNAPDLKQTGSKHNGITTSKYTLYSWIPKGTFEQFRRLANVYFLCISVMMRKCKISSPALFTSICACQDPPPPGLTSRYLSRPVRILNSQLTPTNALCTSLPLRARPLSRLVLRVALMSYSYRDLRHAI